MKSIGIVRKVDELGRVVIPVELRRSLNINEKDGSMVTFDLNSPDSKVIIAGIDHQAANWADMWNLGFFEPDGTTLGSIGFADIQKNEYSNVDSSIAGLAFYIQIKEQCSETDEHCFELNFNNDSNKVFNIMNRVYVNPRTATGPAGQQTAMPVIYVYQ